MNIWWLFDDCMIIWWSSNRRSWAVSQANTVFLMGGSGCWPWNGGPFSHLSYIHPFWWQIFHSLTIDHTDHFLKIWRGPILILESRKTLVFKTSHQHCYQIYHYCMLPYVDWHKWVTHIHTYTYITLHYIRLHYITYNHTIIQSYNIYIQIFDNSHTPLQSMIIRTSPGSLQVPGWRLVVDASTETRPKVDLGIDWKNQ